MTDDKFILMGLDDDNAKNVAEVLKSKTAKKILDYLSETKEASEKDIADKLQLPINTIEYNLKKLISAGFVKKSSNFFWSVKGKKIPMYTPAKKHIIIGAKKPTMNILKSILPLLIIALGLIAVVLLFSFYNRDQYTYTDDSLKTFKSEDELKSFLKQNVNKHYYGGRTDSFTAASAESLDVRSTKSTAGSDDYSTTNIQVTGVDEADIIKNDGKYIYALTYNKAFIIDAFPPEGMKVISEIKFNESESASQMFVNGDTLILFTNTYMYGGGCSGDVCIAQSDVAIASDAVSSKVAESSMIAPEYYGSSWTNIYLYDISDRENIKLEKVIEIDGNYVNSRMIENYVYLISNKNINVNNPVPPIYRLNGQEVKTSVADIYYWGYPDSNYMFTSVSAINVNDRALDSKTFLTGYSSSLYVSEKNIYLTSTKSVDYAIYSEKYFNEVALPLLPGDASLSKIINSDDDVYTRMSRVQEFIYSHSLTLTGKEKELFDQQFQKLQETFETKISKETERTVVHKISMDKNVINFEETGEVPGTVLNQFSMDEHNGNFRIATTTGNWRDTSLNHLYILDEDLDIVGSVEDLAKGERIYSTRFMGDKVYMVTFRQVDPLYVIDASNPENPKVLGYLKVTGYSSYLHPYDEAHIIGIGMEATEDGRVQGLKIALFDVSDFENPKEASKYDLSNKVPGKYSYSHSDALYDHKAFLFSKEKGILVIPVSISSYSEDYSTNEYWQGAYVFNINSEAIEYKGRISHYESENYLYYVRRSLYIGNSLYTFSDLKIKANDLSDLREISSVLLQNDYIK
ncbi:beta-propeller domain-containing protein [Candidatus Pacearchaeota archaeon]|nr:beta-propeller domain-containing protein [Candidatus Pacearchaeota archaeon]